MTEFNGKVAVITGAASGIGRGIPERCLSERVKVLLADIDEANLTRTETELKNPSRMDRSDPTPDGQTAPNGKSAEPCSNGCETR
jgi:NADP-dependent 3-hydroxy acid dehydrogenase YdfG